jgi:polyhydroxyalkanoate synthesis repressor PhaR
MAGSRIVKRYANRKLYDTADKRYVTLDQIATLIREGEEIKVIDNESGEDLTSVTLSQILVEQEKKHEGGLPKSFLNELVKSSTTLFDYLRKTLSSWLSAAQISEEAIERNIDELVKKGQLSLDEGRRLKHDIVQRTREYLDRIDKTIEARVADALRRLNIPTKPDLDALRQRVENIAGRYDTLMDEIRRRAGAADRPQAGPASAAPPAPAAPREQPGVAAPPQAKP